MTARRPRIALIALTAFQAVTAFAGGLALALGWNAPPPEMLAGTPFTGYAIPAAALFVLVGGSALVAAVLAYRRDPRAVGAAAVAAAMILGFETVEVWAIGSPPGAARNLQLLYVAVGLGIALAAMALRRAEGASEDG